MLSQKMQDALNRQINMEISAAYTYLSMSNYFRSISLEGFAGWMNHHRMEELAHAARLMDYVNDRAGKVVLAEIPAPRGEWGSPLDAARDAYDHERKVSKSIFELIDLARRENDKSTEAMLQWFVNEQVEEEKVTSDMVGRLMMAGESGGALLVLDAKLASERPES